MIVKTFSWSKIEKTISKIENDLNSFLENNTFKIATHNQSDIKGRMIISLFCEEGPGKIRAKCFKNQKHQDNDSQINDFITSNKMKFVTQNFIGSNIYTVIYYELA